VFPRETLLELLKGKSLYLLSTNIAEARVPKTGQEVLVEK
jgi:hypothetical protein